MSEIINLKFGHLEKIINIPVNGIMIFLCVSLMNGFSLPISPCKIQETGRSETHRHSNNVQVH